MSRSNRPARHQGLPLPPEGYPADPRDPRHYSQAPRQSGPPQPGFAQPSGQQFPNQLENTASWGQESAFNHGQPLQSPHNYGDPGAAHLDAFGAPIGGAGSYDHFAQQRGYPGAAAGYDFGGYAAPGAGPGFDAPHAATQHTSVDWGQPDPFAVPHTVQPVAAEDQYDEDGDYEYEDEAPPRSGRRVMLLAALAGAIVVGGGFAYGYQTIFGSSESGKPPVVKGASGPSKIKPADPGGRQFAHTDSKIMGRLSDSSTGAASSDPASGARRVSTLTIGKDGTIVPPSAPDAGGAPQRMVAGMTLADTATTPPAGAANDTAADEAATEGQNKPIIVRPPDTSAPEPAAAKETAPVEVAKADPAPKETETAKRAAAPVVKNKTAPKPKAAPAPAATGPKPTGAGYVAVLASVPASKTSRMDALKQFADMQQKYSAPLQSRTPDVQEANLGAKGTYHRLLAGPPGSVESARELCTSLKSAGYTDCWVLAY